VGFVEVSNDSTSRTHGNTVLVSDLCADVSSYQMHHSDRSHFVKSEPDFFYI